MLTVVTGASGHVGNNLVRTLLREGRQLRAVIHENSLPLAGLSIETVRGNVRDAESLVRAFRGADTVFNLAGLVSIADDCWDEVEATNVAGVKNVIAAVKAAGVKRLVHFSSIHAICQEPLDCPVDEARPFVGKGKPPYDRSKAGGERLVQEAAAEGLNAVIIAPTGIIGPFDFQPSHTGQMIISLMRGKLPALVEGGFDWVDVRDVVVGALKAELVAPSGAKYILGGHYAPLGDIADTLKKLFGSKVPGFTAPAWLARVGVPFMERYERMSGKRALYTRASISAICSNKATSHARAARDLGYNPRPLETTLRDTVEWFRENGYL